MRLHNEADIGAFERIEEYTTSIASLVEGD